MEHTKKLVLIEPRVLEQLQQHREYKEIKKEADKRTKAGLSVELQNVLSDGEDNDQKAKLFQQMFSKFMTIGNKIPESTNSAINSTTARQSTARTPRSRRGQSRLNWSQY